MNIQSYQQIRYKDKLYGREEQLTLLSELFESATSDQSQMVIVRGASGMGKSALIKAFAKDKLSDSVCFIQGKQDISQNNPPYSVIINAFTQLIENWSRSLPAYKEIVKSILLKELNEEHTQILTEAFPGLNELLELPIKPIREAELQFKDRFNEALLRFFNALGLIDRKIIIFLDDLQWADASTVQFLKLWLSEGRSNNLFFICACRNPDETAKDKMNGTNLFDRQDASNIRDLVLTGLSVNIIKEMTSDIIDMDSERLEKYSELVFQLTGGNPLYVKESIQYLLNDCVLFYNEDKHLWDYDVSQIKSFNNTSQTLEFVLEKMRSLPKETQDLISFGAAIGANFSAALLGIVAEKSYDEVIEKLQLCEEKYIIEKILDDGQLGTTNYCFLHDKMQNQAYSLMSEERRKWVHFTLGKTYEFSLGHEVKARNIYDVVNQYNRAQSFFDSPEERLNLVQMNVKAGKKAKASSSFQQALRYFQVAIDTIEKSYQNWDQTVVFNLYLESGEAAYLKSDFVSSVMFYESALKYAQNDLDQAKVYHNFLVMYNSVSDMEAAWESGLKVLKLLHVNFPKKIGKRRVLAQFFKAKLLLKKIDPKKLLDREDLTDKKVEQVLLTLMEMIAAAWDRKPEVLAYVVLKGFEIVLQNGNTPIGYFAVSGYGALLGVAFGQVEKGWEFVKLGGELTEKYDSMVFRGRGSFGVYGTYSHLIFHSKNNVAPLKDAFSFSKGAGDYSVASYASIILLENMQAIGVSLPKIQEEAESYLGFLKRTSNYDYLSAQKANIATVNLLSGKVGIDSNQIPEMETRMKRVNFHHIRYAWQMYLLIVMVVLKRKKKAIEIVEKVELKGYNALSSIELIRVIFCGIAKTDMALKGNQVNKTISFLKKQRKEIAKFVKINPANYLQIEELIHALISEIKKDKKATITHYQNAIKASGMHGFLHYHAIFSERLGRFQLSVGEMEEGAKNLVAADAGYSEWGAAQKSLELQQEFPSIIIR